MRSVGLPYRTPILLLIALFCAIPAALAEVPTATIDRLAQISVERQELRHQNLITKITDQEYNARSKALDTEERTLWQPYIGLASEKSATLTAIQGQARAKLSLLEPRWKKEEQAFREAGEGKRRSDNRDIEKNAQEAAQIQKERQGLQAQLEKGALDRAAFNEKDKEALGRIDTLRNKHEGQRQRLFFDERLTLYTSRINDPPPKPAPVAKPTIPHVQKSTPEPIPYADLIVICALIGVALWMILSRTKRPQEETPLTDIHGSARFAPVETMSSDKETVARGVHFGKSSDPQYTGHQVFSLPTVPITSRPENHTLIVAKTGAGKGTRVIVPTLLRYSGSMLVIDPKGENAAICARTRRDQLKQSVHIVNPWGELQGQYAKLGFTTATFNPLDAIDRLDPNAVSVAQSLAATICPPPQGNESPYWQGSAANILSSVFLWLAHELNETKTLERAHEIVTQSREDFKKDLVKMASTKAFGGAIKRGVSQYIDLGSETYGSIISNLANNTKFLLDSQITASTTSSSFDLNKIRDELMTVFIVIPHDRIQTHATWLRLIIAAAMQAMKQRSRIEAPPKHRCMFLIDEFGSIGHIADVPRDIALMRGFGLDFTLIVQGLDQLKHHYGEAKGTIISNCGYKWFCNINELETAKYLSESLGKKTVRTVGKSKSIGTTSQGGTTEGESTTEGETGRFLLNPEEILTLGRDTAILLQPYGAPHYLYTVDYTKLTQAYDFLKGIEPQFYWNPPLQYDDNPYYKPPKPPIPPKPADKPIKLKPSLGTIGEEVFTPDDFPPMTPPKTDPKKPDNFIDPSPSELVNHMEKNIQLILNLNKGAPQKPKPPIPPKPEKPEKTFWGEEVFTEEDFIDPPKPPPKPPDPNNPSGSRGDDVF